MLPEEQPLMIEYPISDLPDMNPFECESRYCTLINNVNIGTYRNTAGSGRYILVNPAMPRIFGYDSVAELMQIAVVDLYRNPEDRNSIMEEVKRNGSVKNRELPMKKKDGTPIWCSFTITAEFDEAREIKWMDGVVEEITGRRKILEEQQSAIEELEGRVRERLSVFPLKSSADHPSRLFPLNSPMDSSAAIEGIESRTSRARTGVISGNLIHLSLSKQCAAAFQNSCLKEYILTANQCNLFGSGFR